MIASGSGRWLRAAALLAASGATIGTVLDGIHTHTGRTEYAHPVFARMAWWVPLLFAGAYTLGLLRPLLERALGNGSAPPSGRAVAGAAVSFVIAYAVSGIDAAWPVITVALIAIAAVSWALFDRSRADVFIAVGAAIGGPLFESALSSTGVFWHTQPVIIGVSGWLPALYLSAAIGLGTFGKWLVDAGLRPRGSDGGGSRQLDADRGATCARAEVSIAHDEPDRVLA